LGELFSNAGLFVLPSYHEGLPIALLEAISYQIPVLVSDIQPNKEVPLMGNRYFMAGDVEKLSEQINRLFMIGITEDEKSAQQELLNRDYNWKRIAERTFKLYEEILV
jgi:glycosyltransferase involved in cell wall biosynthesis